MKRNNSKEYTAWLRPRRFCWLEACAAKRKFLRERDTSLWEAVKNWAKDVAGKIRAIVDAYKGERMDSAEGRIDANMKELLPQLEELYAEGLEDTRLDAVTDSDAGAKKPPAMAG